jgi:hypothetical protein
MIDCIVCGKERYHREDCPEIGKEAPSLIGKGSKLSTEMKIRMVCNELAEFLIAKNRAYGDSATSPIRIFAKGISGDAQLSIRMDDKVNRWLKGQSYPGDDDVKDFVGYWVLRETLKIGED